MIDLIKRFKTQIIIMIILFVLYLLVFGVKSLRWIVA